jgi:MFS transporter, SP family, galactose:H+ symporter
LLATFSEEEAIKVLTRIRGTQDVMPEVNEILEQAETGRGKLSDLFSPIVLPVLFCGVALAVIQQITGINTVIYYAPTIFQAAGFHSAESSILATAGVGLVNVLMTVVSIPLIDRVGRRPLLLISLSGMSVSLAALALGFVIGGAFAYLVFGSVFVLSLKPRECYSMGRAWSISPQCSKAPAVA